MAKVLIANRGEVALRIIRACQDMGLTSVLAHSTPDKNTAAFRAADETIELPGEAPVHTYLNIDAVIEAARAAQADLLHPGFGFLSENADFALRVRQAGIKFVGPTPESMALVGDKTSAKRVAQKLGVPTTPGFFETGEAAQKTSPEKFLAEAEKLGFPCLIKAAAGGGGRGMKVALNRDVFLEKLSAAQAEAQAAFGKSQVFIEKYLTAPRHIEVQIFGDGAQNYVHFYERDCTVQRRHQKLIEESPSPVLSEALRQQIVDAALTMARAARYTSAGTVEFILADDKTFYFMEMNTRLQVEHPVTELLCGVDLVQMQLALALGEKLKLTQDELKPRGHAMEVRICAESPEKQFVPSLGQLARVDLPLGAHRRFEWGFDAGDTITPFYDSMIGKVITWAPTRAKNIERMVATLNELVIFGVETNVEFLKACLASSQFQSGRYSTKFIDDVFGDGFTLPAVPLPTPGTSPSHPQSRGYRSAFTRPL